MKDLLAFLLAAGLALWAMAAGHPVTGYASYAVACGFLGAIAWNVRGAWLARKECRRLEKEAAAPRRNHFDILMENDRMIAEMKAELRADEEARRRAKLRCLDNDPLLPHE